MPERTFSAELAASAEARRHVDDRLGDVFDARKLGDAQLLTTELVSNAVQHARANGDDVVGLDIKIELGTVRVSVTDAGAGFDSGKVLQQVPSEGRGWGLHLVENMSDRWGIDASSPHRVWFEIDR